MSTISLKAQVGIGTANPDSSSILHLESNNKGFLLPKISLSSSTDNSTVENPAVGLLVYNSASSNDITPGIYYWTGSKWNSMSNSNASNPVSAQGWTLKGNSATSTDFLGTTTYQPLNFRVNDIAFGKLEPNGGFNVGRNSKANENQSIAIGENSKADNQIQALAVGMNSNASGFQSAAFGYAASSTSEQSMALGMNSNATGFQSAAIGFGAKTVNNSALALGSFTEANGLNTTALGSESKSTGQNATAIGYRATTDQANAIVLGNFNDSSAKVGIGTNKPDEKLHVAGKVKIVDGTQGEGYILTSNNVGVASWQKPEIANNIYYAELYKSVDTNLNAYDGIPMETAGEKYRLTTNYNNIQTGEKVGVYKVTYTVSLRKRDGDVVNPEFYLRLNGNEIKGSRTFVTLSKGQTETVTFTKLVNITGTYQSISVMSSLTDQNTTVLANGTSLLVEFVR